MSNRLVWTDLETFGLDPERDPIIEIGFLLTDLELKPIDKFTTLIWEEGVYDTAYKNLLKDAENGGDGKFVLDMHNKSGLWDAARSLGGSIALAATEVHEWLDEHDINGKDPLCGSSVGFDRGMLGTQFPDIEQRFHYRNIDISSLKELCLRYNPRVAAKMSEVTSPQKLHRSLPDLMDTIGEFQFYLDNFLWTE